MGGDVHITNNARPHSSRKRPKGPVVVGRIPGEPQNFLTRDLLADLEAGLTSARVVAVVTGMRGVGKTQLAAAYARKMASAGKGLVGWVDAETDGTLVEGLTEIARSLGVEDPDGDSERSAHLLRDHLTTRRGVGLLVFDNATNPDRIREFIPSGGSVRVLITSTDTAFTTFGTQIDVEVYAREESVRFLQKATALDDSKGADQVAAQLGDLPLALAQATATITSRLLDYARYLDLLTQPLPTALTRLDGDDYPLPMVKAIQLSIDTAETATEDAELDTAIKDLLELIAVLSPAGVLVGLLPDMGGRRDKALARCLRGSLLTRSASGDSVAMHRLIARFLRERAVSEPRLKHRLRDRISQKLLTADVGQERTRAFSALLTNGIFMGVSAWIWRYLIKRERGLRYAQRLARKLTSIEFGLARLIANALTVIEANTFSSVDAWQRRIEGVQLIDHIDTLWTISPHPGSNERSSIAVELTTSRLITARNWAISQLISAADLTRAIPYAQDTFADAQRVLGPEHPYTRNSRDALASAYRSIGRVAEAIALYEHTPTTPDWLGTKFPILFSNESLAAAYSSAGRNIEAIALYEQAFANSERTLGPDHPNTLTSRTNLAVEYNSAGRVAEAIALHEQTLAERERVLGPDHPHTLTSRVGLAHAYQSAGKVTEAIKLFEQTLADRERMLSPDHPDIFDARIRLGIVYGDAGRTKKAIALFENALKGFERILGADHPQTLNSRGNLANAYDSAGNSRKALKLREQTLADRLRVLGPDHPDTLTARGNIASSYQSAGRVAEAIELHEQTLANRLRVLGPDHPDTLNSRSNIASSYQSAGRVAEAIELHEQTLADHLRVLGPDHPHTLTARGGLAHAYESAGRVAEAIKLFEQTLANRLRVLGPDHPDSLTSRGCLAHAYKSAGKMAEAIKLLEQTLADRVRVLGPGHPRTLASRNNLANARRRAQHHVDNGVVDLG